MEKKYFNKEQIEKLKEVEQHFRTVVRAQWKRGTTVKENNMMADIYEETTGKKLNRNWACGQCVYNAYMTVGLLYFESIEIVQNETEPILETNELEETVTNNEPKKRGRKKKV